MKYLYTLCFFLLPACVLAQPGYITTIIGNGSSGFSGDGGPATAARIQQALGSVVVDGWGNTYYSDHGNGRIRRVDPFGNISTIAGGGSSTADGIPATTASLGFYGDGKMAIGADGNLYMVDNHRIRKIDLITHVITTVAGTVTMGFSGDGGPATSAQLRSPVGICFDAVGNLYIGDEDNYRIRKVDTAGIISTIAGDGTNGFGGDGGPATAAQLKSPDGICSDAAGNLYFADRYNYRIRKIDTSGIITTIAGIGSGFSGDGGPATAARFSEPSQVCIDNHGNLYIADFHNSRVRRIDLTGTITTFAGGGASSGDGIPATNASFSDVWAIGVDVFDNVYVADRNHNCVVKVGGSGGTLTATSDSFSVYTNTTCTNTGFTITPTTYSSSLSVKTYFGDGLIQTNSFAFSGAAWFGHSYSFPGVYTIKHVLYNGASPIDSESYNYNYHFCRTLPVKIFIDDDANCTYNNTIDRLASLPIALAIDSSGIRVDTVPVSSGLYYDGHGPIGTLYTFTPINLPAGITASCPSAGVVSHTLTSYVSTPPAYLALACASGSSHDLRLFTSFNAHVNRYRGTILVDNPLCTPPAATITLNMNPRYMYMPYFNPAPTSVSGSVVKWNVNTLSALSATPSFAISVDIKKTVGALLPFGDTVQTAFSVTPLTGDVNTANNMIIREDTVIAAYDPNDISVSPSGCLTSANTKLTYTIRFENTGNAPAYNIYVLDTLPAEVDVKSMRIEAASAVMNTYIKKVGGRNIVRFEFPDINLPDSAHGQNTGMVVYSINRNPSLSDGTHIRNRVGIYFDDNPPVLTNTAENTIGCPITSVNEVTQQGRVEVFPNPATNELFINAPGAIYTTCTITNSIGQVMLRQEVLTPRTKLNIVNLPAGIYYVTLRGAQTEVHKVVKL